MKKEVFALLTAVVLTTMLCSCGKSESEKETMTDNNPTNEAAESITEIDKDSFAAGIKTDDESSVTDGATTPTPAEATPAVTDGENGTDATPEVTAVEPIATPIPTAEPTPTPLSSTTRLKRSAPPL